MITLGDLTGPVTLTVTPLEASYLASALMDYADLMEERGAREERQHNKDAYKALAKRIDGLRKRLGDEAAPQVEAQRQALKAEVDS
jgi:hypothetical protein